MTSTSPAPPPAPEIRPARSVAELIAAEGLFDAPVRPAHALDFLEREGHHLLLAYAGEEAVGFVSGVETAHPDKGAEMLLYELGVAPAHRHRGIGRSLIEALTRVARDRGCHGMWVGVETGNTAALAAYRSAGAVNEGRFAMLGWEFG
ncbi:GNAT family N-acetyltransferase [Streptomyces sp. NPDC058374]|uniref:GNAT family N-acetyltransferase n=1 Tax=unclassified Streptomyces TaxID=2593676 RepID=UPI0036511FBA